LFFVASLVPGFLDSVMVLAVLLMNVSDEATCGVTIVPFR